MHDSIPAFKTLPGSFFFFVTDSFVLSRGSEVQTVPHLRLSGGWSASYILLPAQQYIINFLHVLEPKILVFGF